MKLRELTESVDQDVAMADASRRAAMVVSHSIYNGAAKPLIMADIDGADFLLYDPADCGLDGYEDVALLFGLEKPGSHDMSGDACNLDGVVMGRFRRAIIIHGLDHVTAEDVRSLVNSTEFLQLFHHEFMHIQDYIRSNDGILKGGSKFSQGDKAYYNDPAEFNAYFHEVADRLTHMISEMKGVTSQERKELFDLFNLTGNFSKDIARLTKGTNAHTQKFLQWLTEDRRRALIKRLYKLHQEMMRLSNQSLYSIEG